MAPLIAVRALADDDVRAFIRAHAGSALSYDSRGATVHGAAPAGFDVDRREVRLGGDASWDRARRALSEWAMFELGWVRIVGDVSPPPIAEGTVVAIVATRLGLTFANLCRIVAVIDEPDRFGFAYGTLDAHVERGEERFLLTRSPDGVRFEILAYSRPAHWLAKLGRPYVRRSQHRFARDACDAIARVVASDSTSP